MSIRSKRPLTHMAMNPVQIVNNGLSPPVAAQGFAQAEEKKASPRFRSFVERYVIERSAYFRKDPEGLAEDQWLAILDGKRLYAMINRVGQGAAYEGMDD